MRTALVRIALFGSVAAAMLAVAAAAPAPASGQPGGARNLGISGGSSVALDGGGFAFTVPESGEGRDLNGDGDTGDWVVHRVDGAGVASNLGLVGHTREALDGGGFTFTVHESWEGQDLNGDGDTGDDVVHWMDAAGGVSSVGLASPGTRMAALDGGGFTFGVSESGEGRDLNGDADTGDEIVHWVDGAGAVSGVGLAAGSGDVAALDGGGFMFGVSESGEGRDLNGDADTGDEIVHWVDGAGVVSNAGLAGGLATALDGGGFALVVYESEQGRDLNGDGDTGDRVVHWVDGAGVVSNLGLAAYEVVALDSGGFAFEVFESGEGRDLNGDGDTGDRVVHWVDGAGVVSNSGLAVHERVMALDGGGFVFSVRESDQGEDLNGNGQMNDALLYRVDGAGAVSIVPLDGNDGGAPVVALDGGGFVFEAWGELVWLDGAGAVSGIGQPADWVHAIVALEGGGFTYSVDEWDVGDQNGDGDNDDQALNWVHGDSQDSNVGLAGDNAAALEGGGFVFSVGEDDEGRDLNGDGDMEDSVVHVSRGISVFNTAVPSAVAEPGGPVTYTVTMVNHSVVDAVTIDSLVDSVHGPLAGDGDCQVGTVLAAGGSCSFDFVGAVSGDAGNTRYGRVTVGGIGDDGASVLGWGDASVTITDVASSITVTKDPGRTYVREPAMDMHFTVSVTNTSPVDAVTITSMYDTDVGWLSGQSDCGVGWVLAAGASCTFIFEGPVWGSAGSVYPAGTLTVDAIDDDGQSVWGSDDATVMIAEPPGPVEFWSSDGETRITVEFGGTGAIYSAVGVEPPVDVTPPAGATFPYGLVGITLVGVDPGGTARVGVYLDEPMPEPFAYYKLLGGVYVDATSTASYDGAAVVLTLVDNGALDADPTPGVITDLGGLVDLHLSQWLTVDNVPDPSAVGEPGGLVTHTVTVVNHSLADTATIGSLSDDVYGVLVGDGDCQVGTVLAAGASCSFTFVGAVSGVVGSHHPDTVTVGGTGAGATALSGSDTASVSIIDVVSSIAVSMDANPGTVAEPGGDVFFSVMVANTSVADTVTIHSLTDGVVGDLNGRGDCVTPQVLGVGQSYSCSFTASVSGTPGSTRSGTVTVGGVDDDGASVSGSDDATVMVSDVVSSIAVSLDAVPGMVAVPGGDVSYSLTVANTSAADAVTVGSLVDSVVGDLNGRGDCVTPQVLGVGQSYSCSFTANVAGSAGGGHTSTVAVGGVDDDGASVSGGDDATVLVTEAAGPVEVQSSGGDEIVVALDGGGVMWSVEAVDPPPDVTPPVGASFPYGLVGFSVVGVEAGAPVAVTVDFPAPLAEPFAYYKLVGGAYVDATSIAAHDGGGRVTLTLVDNGPFDADATPGVIADPGGPVAVLPPTGSLVISKVFDPLSSGLAGTFPIDWSCDNGAAGSVEVAGGASATVDSLPAGTVCSVTEARPGGAPAGWSWADPTVTGSPATITAGAPVMVTVTNRIVRSTSSLRVTKVVNGGPRGYVASFGVVVACSGDGGSYSRSILYPLLRSATIAGIPTNTQCSVSEPGLPPAPAGYRWAAPKYSAASVTIVAGRTAAVTVTNTLVRVDTVAPSATFMRPGLNNPLLRGRPIRLNGWATDNVGVVSVSAAIRNTATGRYLQPNGTWATDYAALSTTLSAPGAKSTGWSISRALPDGSYSIELVPTDAAGNTTTPRPTRNFRVDAP